MLTGISGVGGKLALSVLSTLNVPDLVTAIQTDDSNTLTSVPGIGKKSASRIALELKDKVGRLNPDSALPAQPASPDHIHDDAISALVNLGYRPKEVKDLIAKIERERTSPLGLDDLIRETLKQLSKH